MLYPYRYNVFISVFVCSVYHLVSTGTINILKEVVHRTVRDACNIITTSVQWHRMLFVSLSLQTSIQRQAMWDLWWKK